MLLVIMLREIMVGWDPCCCCCCFACSLHYCFLFAVYRPFAENSDSLPGEGYTNRKSSPCSVCHVNAFIFRNAMENRFHKTRCRHLAMRVVCTCIILDEAAKIFPTLQGSFYERGQKHNGVTYVSPHPRHWTFTFGFPTTLAGTVHGVTLCGQ